MCLCRAFAAANASRAFHRTPNSSCHKRLFSIDKSATFSRNSRRMKTSIRSLALITLAIVGFSFLPSAQAVVPPPDGGYPGGNTAEGQNALLSLTTGTFNTAVGLFSLRSATTGSDNTAIGAGALLANTSHLNTATGAGALLSNTNGQGNTANGALALFNNLGGHNTAVGANALFSNILADQNTAIGGDALYSNTAGELNTAVGSVALRNNVTGDSNTAIGNVAGFNITGSGNVCIGAGVQGFASVNDTTWIRNVYASAAFSRVVYVNSDNKIGTLASSRRFKEEIKPMDKASEVLFALKPVSFRYKKEFDAGRAPMFGLIAEEVEQVDPTLVSRNEKGEVETVRYDAVNAMLLNEFLKEHKRVEELNCRLAEQETIVAQQKQEFREMIVQQDNKIRGLMATVEKQAAQIQKVSAQIAVSKAPLLAAESP